MPASCHLHGLGEPDHCCGPKGTRTFRNWLSARTVGLDIEKEGEGMIVAEGPACPPCHHDHLQPVGVFPPPLSGAAYAPLLGEKARTGSKGDGEGCRTAAPGTSGLVKGAGRPTMLQPKGLPVLPADKTICSSREFFHHPLGATYTLLPGEKAGTGSKGEGEGRCACWAASGRAAKCITLGRRMRAEGGNFWAFDGGTLELVILLQKWDRLGLTTVTDCGGGLAFEELEDPGWLIPI